MALKVFLPHSPSTVELYSSKRFKLRWISFRRQSEEAKKLALISGSVLLKFLLFGKYSPAAMLRPT